MKSLHNFTGKMTGCLIALVLAITATNLAASSGTATVIRLQGKARYTTGNNVWLPLQVGHSLRSGTLIQTASESWLDLTFDEGEDVAPQPVVHQMIYRPGSEAGRTIVRLRENTLMAIDRFMRERTGADIVTETQLDLRTGQILGNVKKMSAASRFEVKFSNGVAGIRGTLFSISASGLLTVFEGSVVVSFMDPADPTHQNIITVVVNAGEQFDIPTNVKKPIPMGTKPETLESTPLYRQPTTYTYGTTPYYISPVNPGEGD